MFSKKEDAKGPKQVFDGSAAKKKSLPDYEKTSEPEVEFGGGNYGGSKNKKKKMKY